MHMITNHTIYTYDQGGAMEIVGTLKGVAGQKRDTQTHNDGMNQPVSPEMRNDNDIL